MQFLRISFNPITKICFLTSPHRWKWTLSLKNTVANDEICCCISRHSSLRVQFVQWIGASLTFYMDAFFLNKISELFVSFDPKYWEPAHVSLLNAWETVARHLSLIQWFLEILPSTRGHLFFSSELIQCSWSLKPISRLNYAEWK